MRNRGSLVLIATLLAAACGRQEPDFVVHGAGVFVESAAPFARQPEFPERVRSTAEVALRYWGGGPGSLRGRTITFGGDYVSCNGHERALGCFDGNIRVATADPGIGTFLCVEQTVLVHEIGHSVIGDPFHEDPRWMQFDEVANALAGRVGWEGPGEPVECALYPSVWRHPRGRP